MTEDQRTTETDSSGSGAGSDLISVSRSRFQKVPQQRSRYIVLYLLILVLWFVPNIIVVMGYQPSFGQGFAVVLAVLLCQVVMYVNLVAVLRTMAYPTYLIIAICCIVFLPVPGVLVMAYVDRHVAKAWDAADARLHDREPMR